MERTNYAFIGDIHSQIQPLREAVEYCKSNNLRPVFLGDVFDSRCDTSDSVAVYHLLREVQSTMNAVVLRSNHQDKFERYLRGNSVRVAIELQRSIDDFAASEVPAEELLQWLESLPYGFCFKQDGMEYRCAHAYFPSWQEVEEYEQECFIREATRKARQLMMYGPQDKLTRHRVFWWERPSERQWVRVAGHYHVIHCGDNNLVLDGGCGSKDRSWFCREQPCLVLYNLSAQELIEFETETKVVREPELAGSVLSLSV